MLRFALFLLFFCATSATAQPFHVIGKPYVVKYLFLDSLWELCTHPDSDIVALKLPGIEKSARDNGDLELATDLELLNVRVQLLNSTDDTIIAKLKKIAEFSKENKLYKVQANALKLLGELWSSRGNFSEAFENDLAAYQIYSRFSPGEFPQKQCYLYVLGTHYMQYGDEETAMKLYKEAKATADPLKHWTKLVNNAIGLHYRRTGRYDSARLYFQQVYDEAVRVNETPWIGIAAGNMGICFFYEKKYNEALPLLEKDIQYSIATRQLKNAIGSMTYLSEIYFIQGDLSKGEKTLYDALALGYRKDWWPDYKLAEPIYRLLSKIHAGRNNMKLAYIYGDSANIAKDSFLRRFNALSLAKAQEKALIADRRLQTEQLNYQKKIHILTRNGLIACIVLLMTIAFLMINKQKLKHKKLEAEKKNAEAELFTATKLLDGFRQSVREKNNIIEEITGQMAHLKEGETQQVDDEVVARLEKTILLTDEQWEEFRVLFEKVHKGFFKRVKEKMPDLTPAELRFVALSKLKLTPKEMATMLGISSGSIRNYRHRLRRKLGLDEDASIEDIADAI